MRGLMAMPAVAAASLLDTSPKCPAAAGTFIPLFSRFVAYVRVAARNAAQQYQQQYGGAQQYQPADPLAAAAAAPPPSAPGAPQEFLQVLASRGPGPRGACWVGAGRVQAWLGLGSSSERLRIGPTSPLYPVAFGPTLQARPYAIYYIAFHPSSLQAALVDPNDPSKIYLTQPVDDSQRRQDAPKFGGGLPLV